MTHSSIANSAGRLRWVVWIAWGSIIAIYIAGRLGLDLGFLKVQAKSDPVTPGPLKVVGDATLLLVSMALWNLSRMLGAIASGDLFSARVVGAFRSFALWLLIVAIVWIVGPIVAGVISGPDADHAYAFKLQLRDLLTIGITLILFLVARLLERARAIDEEMREIV